MSIQILARAIAATRSKPSARLVLIALCDAADGAGRCWPKVSRLRAFTGLSDSSVRRAIQDLEKAGEIRVEERGGGAPGGQGRASTYQILVGLDHVPAPAQNDRPSCQADREVPVTLTPTSLSDCQGVPVSLTEQPCQADRDYKANSVIEPSVNRQCEGARTRSPAAEYASRNLMAVPCPKDLKPSQTMIDRIRREWMVEPEDVQRFTDQFLDYYRGSHPRALNWWQNQLDSWILRDAGRLPRRNAPRPAYGAAESGGYRTVTVAEAMARRAERMAAE
ncbi:MAG: helix-turn-helix domain-containing protein [Pseudomonadota bacterium]